jgi:ATP-dependent DNA helicase RecG
MNLNEAKSKISKSGESKTVELKKSTASLKSAAQTLCAFLNGRGGTVFIGVSDSGKMIGQTITNKTKIDISNTLKKFEPTANIDIEYIDMDDGHQIIAMTAHPDNLCVPYSFSGTPYEREQADTHIMNQSRYQQLILSRNVTPVSWELLMAEGLTIEDLDHEEIINTVRDGVEEGHLRSPMQGKDIEYVLTKFNLLRDSKPKKAAIALFGNNVVDGYIQCTIRMARFKGVKKGAFVDKKQITANAFTILREAENFIARNTAVSATVIDGQMQRVEKAEYPYKAIREALINSLCHRDYASPGGSITLVIYDDRLELINTGLLPAGITLDQLKGDHSSHPRNPYITNVFNKRGFIEAMGMGTQAIIDACLSEGMKTPEFLEQGGTFIVRLWSGHFHGADAEIISQLTDRQNAIISVLGDSKLAPNEILEKLEGGIPERTLRRELSALREKGVIDLEGAQGWKRRWFVIGKKDGQSM